MWALRYSMDHSVSDEISAYLKKHRLLHASDLSEPLDLDSFAVINLIVHLEQKYQLIFYSQEVDPKHFGTVAAISELVQSKLARVK